MLFCYTTRSLGITELNVKRSKSVLQKSSMFLSLPTIKFLLLYISLCFPRVSYIWSNANASFFLMFLHNLSPVLKRFFPSNLINYLRPKMFLLTPCASSPYKNQLLKDAFLCFLWSEHDCC